jgi:hemerythrin-like domain-containing protein
MKLLDTLQDEHVLIDRMLGSLRAYVDGLVAGTADAEDGRRFAAFFTEFAGHFHHDREERVFFRALVAQAELPADRGPVYALARDHAEMEEWLREMAPLLGQRPQSADDAARLRALATRYSRALWRHIDAENSVLFPEGGQRLVLCGVHELADRPMSEAEAAAREGSSALLVRYPPVEDAALTRGDGCFMCRAHGETCNGLEAEWWTELEWQEFYARD